MTFIKLDNNGFKVKCCKMRFEGATEVKTRELKTDCHSSDVQIEWLDRHRLDCNQNRDDNEYALNRFKWTTESCGDRQFKLEYRCTSATVLPVDTSPVLPSAPLQAESKHTNENPLWHRDIEYLDRHSVDCGAKGISYEVVSRRGGDNGVIDYKCVNIPVNADECYDVRSKVQKHIRGKIDQLLQLQETECNNVRDVMTFIKLDNNGFKVKCCKPPWFEGATEVKTRELKMDCYSSDVQIEWLDRYWLDCN
jgi:hypothetical protein